MTTRDDIGRTVEMPYLTWKAIEQQVETLTEDRVSRNARIRDLEAERDALADALRQIAEMPGSAPAGDPRRAARAALDRHTQADT